MNDWLAAIGGLQAMLVGVAATGVVLFICAKPLLSVSRIIDAANAAIGRVAAWFVFFSVIVSAGNALVRYTANTSSNAWLEIQWIFFSVTFLLCVAWTLQSNELIRIDIVNAMLPKPVRNVIDLIGHTLFLLPLCWVMVWHGWPFMLQSIHDHEQSPNPGGLIVWPSKMLIPLAFTLLLLQALSEIIKRSAIIRGFLAETVSGGGHHAAAAAEASRLRQTLASDVEARADR